MSIIVGIGELLWDIYPDGRKVAGGAPFNFAFHCHQLGHKSAIVSRVGDDVLGKELREEVKRLGLHDAIEVDFEHPTGTVQVTVDESGQPTYRIADDVAWDYIGNEGDVGGLDERNWHDVKVLCYGSLAQRCPVSRSSIQEIIRDVCLLRVFDVNFRSDQIDERFFMPSFIEADWVKLNRDEFENLNRQLKPGWFDRINREYGYPARTQIITRGVDGVSIICDQEFIEELSVPATVIDTVGTGDAYTAAMVVMHIEGWPLRGCARFANHYAARVCEHRGATPKIDRREVELAAFGKSR